MAKPERGGEKYRNSEALFLSNLSELNRRTLLNLNLISRPDWSFFPACLGFVVVGVFLLGFVLWLLFLTVFNLSDPGLRKTKNPPQVLKDSGYFICSSFSILQLSLDG